MAEALPAPEPDSAPRGGFGIRTALGCLGLFLLAVVLHAWALGWGVPDPTRYYTYHPDEAVLLAAVGRVNPLWGDFTPTFYNYGSLFILLTRFVFDLVAPQAGWPAVPGDPAKFPEWVDGYAHLLGVGRCLAVLLGAGTVVLVQRLGARLFGARVGWLAALALAVAPMPVLLGHYMAVDVPAAFFTTWALLLAATALHSEPRRALGLVVGAGFVAGLAVGTKYTSAVVLLSLAVPLAHAWRAAPERRALVVAAAVGALLAAAVGFVLSTPGALLQPKTFRAHLGYELGLNQQGMGLVFRDTPPAALYHLIVSLPIALEWPLYVLALAGVGYALRRREPADWLLLLFVGGTYLALAPAERKYVRYVVALLPPLCVLAARLVHTASGGRRRRLWTAWGGVALAAAALSTLAHLGVLGGTDPRDGAVAYLRAHAAPTDTVALSTDPWFYTPPVHATAGCVKEGNAPYGGPPIWERITPGVAHPEPFPLTEYQVVAPAQMTGALPLKKLDLFRPRFVVISDYEYEDAQRIRAAEPGFDDGHLALLERLERDYRVAWSARPRPALGPLVWWSRGIPPHDWRYYMPEVRVYERR